MRQSRTRTNMGTNMRRAAASRRRLVGHSTSWRVVVMGWKRRVSRGNVLRALAHLGGLVGVSLVVITLAALLAAHAPSGARNAAGAPFLGTANAPEVSVALDLHDPELHPRQLAYDARRNGLCFWTSTQERGVTFDNHVYFYDLAARQVRSWPLYEGDWSSQLLAGLAVGPDGTVWIGWSHHLLAFQPSDGTYTRYELPAPPRYPLPAEALHGLPGDLGIADLAVAPNGTVWLARYAAQSLTSFSPASGTFEEHALPAGAGDPAKLALGPDGHLFFTIDLSADHPGYAFERVGEYDPSTGDAWVYPQPATALVAAPNGDLYTTLDGGGLARLSASERASAHARQSAPVFARQVTSFTLDGAALAVDGGGRVWMAVGGQPEMAVLDPGQGLVRQFQYAAPSVAAHPQHRMAGNPLPTVAPNAVWLSHIAAMTTDGQGHLWYIRAGSDRIEEVAA